MINHKKLSQRWDGKSFYERSFENVLDQENNLDYDFFYKENYNFTFYNSKCIYEPNECIIEKNDIIVDLGSNIGFFTDHAVQKCKKVISIVASPELFSCLVKNTKNDHSNIEYLNAEIVASPKQQSRKRSLYSDTPSRIKITIDDIFDLY